MSFGWSAGDIAQAVILIVRVVKALDDADGAGDHYRKAVAYLQSLKHTLEPLHTFTALGAYPAYRDEIQTRLEAIREPIERFLASVTKFDDSFGPNATSGHHRHIARKLQWRFIASKGVEKLKSDVDAHMRVLETLLHRLTLDMIWTVHNNLRGELWTAFTDIFDPRLLGLLQAQSQPLRLEIQDGLNAQDTQVRALRAEVRLCSDAIQELRDSGFASMRLSDDQVRGIVSQLEGQSINLKAVSDAIENHITANIRKNSIQNQLLPPEGFSTSSAQDPENNDMRETKSQIQLQRQRKTLSRESLREVYYLVLLSLAQFLRNLFIYLANAIQPSRALVPILSAKHHISFFDAIGRPPRILDYSCFINYNVFQAFLQDSFSDGPGATWVARGLYRLSNARNGQVITRQTWAKMVSPGSRIHMSMLIVQTQPDTSNHQRCPASDCSGILQGGSKISIGKCSSCDMEIMNPQLETAKVESLAPSPETQQLTQITSTKFGPPELRNSDELGFQDLNEVDLSDVVHFKRVIRQQLGLTETNDVSKDGKLSLVELQSFHFRINDTVAQILPGALRKYKINAPWQEYSLFIVYDDLERCLDLGEKPLAIARELSREGRKPAFMLRRKQEMIQTNRIHEIVFQEKRNIVSPNVDDDDPQRRNQPDRRCSEVFSSLDSVSVLGVEQLLPKLHRCAKGERCKVWRKQQKRIEKFRMEDSLIEDFQEENNFDDWFSTTANPGNQITTEISGGLGPLSSAVPSVIASSDVLGAGQDPLFSNLEEANLRNVEPRDPLEAVKQFLEFQHVDINIHQYTWSVKIIPRTLPKFTLDERWPSPAVSHTRLIPPPPLHARKIIQPSHLIPPPPLHARKIMQPSHLIPPPPLHARKIIQPSHLPFAAGGTLSTQFPPLVTGTIPGYRAMAHSAQN